MNNEHLYTHPYDITLLSDMVDESVSLAHYNLMVLEDNWNDYLDRVQATTRVYTPGDLATLRYNFGSDTIPCFCSWCLHLCPPAEINHTRKQYS